MPTPEQIRQAVAALQAELTRNAPAIARILAEPLPGEETDTTPADLATVRLAAREHEVFEKITQDSPWQRCQHGKRIVEVMAYWSDDAPFTVTTGRVNSTQRFPRTVHADGTPTPMVDGMLGFEYNTVSRCPKCEALDTLSTAQEAWCDVTTCSACDYRNIYMIGD